MTTPSSSNLGRRTIVVGGAATGAIAVLPGMARAQGNAAQRPLASDPFTLGVASGDPSPDGFVLWTRLAVDPLAEDGFGGMPSRPVPVKWQVAEDENFARIVRTGTHVARPEWGHSVHVELTDLKSDRE